LQPEVAVGLIVLARRQLGINLNESVRDRWTFVTVLRPRKHEVFADEVPTRNGRSYSANDSIHREAACNLVSPISQEGNPMTVKRSITGKRPRLPSDLLKKPAR